MLQILTADLDEIMIYNLEIVDFQTLQKYSSVLETLAQSLKNDDIHSGQQIMHFNSDVWKFYQKIIFQHFCFIQ